MKIPPSILTQDSIVHRHQIGTELKLTLLRKVKRGQEESSFLCPVITCGTKLLYSKTCDEGRMKYCPTCKVFYRPILVWEELR